MSANASTPLAVAPTPQAVAAHMLAGDRATRAMGMRIDAVGDGTATLSMPVRDDMLNGHGICHGGFITTLADSAFAFACNARNVVTVASGLSVEFLKPAQGGDVLTATAVEVSSHGRTGIWDMTVVNGAGERIALVRGKAHRLEGRSVMPVDGAGA